MSTKENVGRLHPYTDPKLMQEIEAIYRFLTEIFLKLEALEKRIYRLEHP
jgi:hypothetical protein